MPEHPIQQSTQHKDSPQVDPLTLTLNKWRWKPVTPCDENTARRIGGAYFEFLFDENTTLEPQNPDEKVFFDFYKKKFSVKEGNISIEPVEIATVLRLLQSAALEKLELQKDRMKSTSTIAADAALDELYALLEQVNPDFLTKVDETLGKPTTPSTQQ